jgi:hypothetical protein
MPHIQRRSFALSKLFSTAVEAKAAAVEEAIGWTDERLAFSHIRQRNVLKPG